MVSGQHDILEALFSNMYQVESSSADNRQKVLLTRQLCKHTHTYTHAHKLALRETLTPLMITRRFFSVIIYIQDRARYNSVLCQAVGQQRTYYFRCWIFINRWRRWLIKVLLLTLKVKITYFNRPKAERHTVFMCRHLCEIKPVVSVLWH